MRVLVIGGTGKVGSLLVNELRGHGVDLCVLTRSAERAKALPLGVSAIVANITQDPDSAAAAFAGVDMTFMLNQPTLEEMVEGLLAIHLAQRAGVGRFVYQSVHEAERMAYIPHVAAKLSIESGLKASALRWTILRPNYFFQNDVALRASLEHGDYDAPIGEVGVAAIDTGDIAAAAATVLLEEGHEGRTYNLVGPDLLTGATCAAIWSDALGRPIRDLGDVAVWRDTTRRFLPAWFNYDLGMMYTHLSAHGMPAGPDDLASVSALLGRSPRTYRNFAYDQAAAWRALPSAA